MADQPQNWETPGVGGTVYRSAVEQQFFRAPLDYSLQMLRGRGITVQRKKSLRKCLLEYDIIYIKLYMFFDQTTSVVTIF